MRDGHWGWPRPTQPPATTERSTPCATATGA